MLFNILVNFSENNLCIFFRGYIFMRMGNLVQIQIRITGGLLVLGGSMHEDLFLHFNSLTTKHVCWTLFLSEHVLVLLVWHKNSAEEFNIIQSICPYNRNVKLQVTAVVMLEICSLHLCNQRWREGCLVFTVLLVSFSCKVHHYASSFLDSRYDVGQRWSHIIIIMCFSFTLTVT